MNPALAMKLGDSIPQYNRSREPAKDLAARTFQQTVRGLDKHLHKILGLEIVSRSWITELVEEFYHLEVKVIKILFHMIQFY